MQGDPLSPLLFTVVIDYLSKLISQALRERKIELYTTDGVTVESHLVFADDVVFFYHSLNKSIRAL